MAGITNAAKFGFSELDLMVPSTDASLIERDVKIFKTGTFTDMFGRTRTWTAEDLDKAVEHFYLLRDQNVIPNVPVREDHTISVKDIVGYFLSVRRVGEFLFGDWEWASWEAKSKWDDKKYRNRSIEIGQYVTNDGTKYDPVVLGLAFVDFPAVEGLYRIADHHGDDNMSKTPEEIAAEQAAADQAAADQAAADAAAAQAAADQAAADQAAADAAAQAAADAAAAQAAADQAAADAAAQDGALVGAHRANMQPHAFRLNGEEVLDYARVQAHIVELESFRETTIETARDAFVTDLADKRVITGPQAEKFRALVKTMSPEQFDGFKEGFDGAAPANLFARHDLGDGGAPLDADAAKQDRISVLTGIVASHRARGASAEEISKLGSYQELQTLTATA
jgi:hypothetical protein